MNPLFNKDAADRDSGIKGVYQVWTSNMKMTNRCNAIHSDLISHQKHGKILEGVCEEKF